MTGSIKTEVTATLPDFALKKKLDDVSIRDVFTEDMIASADSAIEESKKDFFSHAKAMVDNMETAFNELYSSPEAGKKAITVLKNAAHSLKGQSETLGFDLLAHVSKSLYDFCREYFSQQNSEQAVVLRKHLDTLQLIVREKIQGDGAATGKALIDSLKQLNLKYAS